MSVTDLRAAGREPKSGKRYETIWYDATGRRRTKRFRTQKEARDHEADMRIEKERFKGSSVDDRRAKRTTVTELHREHMEAIERDGGRGGGGGRGSTVAGYESQYTNWIAPTLGDLKVSDVNREVVNDWRDNMKNPKGDPPSQRTRSTVVKQASRLFTYAVEEGLLRDNPSKTRGGKLVGTPKPRKEKVHIYLDEQQVWRLVAVAKQMDPTTHDVILTMVSTGIRFGELSALTAEDLDPDTGDLEITKAYASAHGRLMLERTKGGEGRVVRVKGNVLDMLAKRASTLRTGELLFAGSEGAPLRLDNWRPRKFYPVVDAARSIIERTQEQLGVTESKRGLAWWGPKTADAYESAVQAGEDRLKALREGADLAGPPPMIPDPVLTTLGAFEPKSTSDLRRIYTEKIAPMKQEVPLSILEGSTDFPKLTPHDLRHTAVSVALRRGASVKAVQAIAGHSSAKITLDVYAGLFDDERESVASTLQDAFANPHANI